MWKNYMSEETAVFLENGAYFTPIIFENYPTINDFTKEIFKNTPNPTQVDHFLASHLYDHVVNLKGERFVSVDGTINSQPIDPMSPLLPFVSKITTTVFDNSDKIRFTFYF
jgi:hypothetical protein